MDFPKPNPEKCFAYHEGLKAWCRTQAFALAGLECSEPDISGNASPVQKSSCVLLHEGGTHPNKSFEFPRIGIIGAGLMGASIAAWHLKEGCRIVITDSSMSALESLTDRLIDELREYGSTDLGKIDAILANMRITGQFDDLADCDCILESIVEDVAAKRQLFSSLEQYVRPEVIILSNTSTIPIGKLAKGLRYPERVCGLHFLHPVRCRDLVEVIPHSATDRAVIGRVVKHAAGIGKLPVLVKDTPGFVVNRLLFPYLNEALELMAEGISPEIIDRAAAEVGFDLGPVSIMDEIGLDTTWSAGRILWEAFPKRITPSPILVTMLKHKRLGRKTGRGFFDYSQPPTRGGVRPLDPETSKLIASWIGSPPASEGHSIPMRLVLAMALEAVLILSDGAADDPRTIDACAVFGLGFPRSLGGPLFWIQSVGFSTLRRLIDGYCRPALATEIFKAIENVAKRDLDHSLVLDEVPRDRT
jgi:3-hydroxyacyl-CoA dehydrogenase